MHLLLKTKEVSHCKTLHNFSAKSIGTLEDLASPWLIIYLIYKIQGLV